MFYLPVCVTENWVQSYNCRSDETLTREVLADNNCSTSDTVLPCKSVRRIDREAERWAAWSRSRPGTQSFVLQWPKVRLYPSRCRTIEDATMDLLLVAAECGSLITDLGWGLIDSRVLIESSDIHSTFCWVRYGTDLLKHLKFMFVLLLMFLVHFRAATRNNQVCLLHSSFRMSE